ncbi:hypothetical protein D3C81_1962940 [compost metagenome]
MLTGFIRGFALLLAAGAAHHRAHPRPGREHIGGNHLGPRELPGTRLQQILELLAADARALVQVLAMIQVGGADHGGTFPGEHKHRPAIARVQESERLCHRQTPARQQQMTATQRPQLPASARRS